MMRQTRSVFIVDDDESVGKALSRLVRSAGFEAESFRTPQSFLDSVPLDDAHGVLILDLRMPGMGGFELFQRLKEFRCDLKVLFITGHAQPGDRERAMREGALGFLLKPFSDESLLELINDAMKEDRP